MSRIPSASLVRPATGEDATAIATIHAADMLRQLRLGLDAELDADITDQFDEAAIAESWQVSIENKPSAKHHVLVALDGDRVAGFIALAPYEDDSIDAEIIALAVENDDEEHAARLLNAAADVLGLSKATSMLTWVMRGDDARVRLLNGSGFAPLGVRRQYEVGDGGVTEDAWWAELGEPAAPDSNS